jgi:phage terminase Nu1 subunit (DNA packaging protein)
MWVSQVIAAGALLVALVSLLLSRRDKGAERAERLRDDLEGLRRALEQHRLEDAKQFVAIERFVDHERDIAEEFRRFRTTVSDLSRTLWQRGRGTRGEDDLDR